jgi:hypothetical protein
MPFRRASAATALLFSSADVEDVLLALVQHVKAATGGD